MAGQAKRKRSEWIQVAALPEDKTLVQRIAQSADDGVISRTVIRLIRQEGHRLGMLADGAVPLPVVEQPEQEPA